MPTPTLHGSAHPGGSPASGLSRFTLVYGVAHGGKTLFWTASDLYFAFYMNEICGIAPATTGAIVGASVLFAALTDLFIGKLVSVGAGNARRAARLQMMGAGISSGALLLFAAVAFMPSGWQIVGSIAALLLFRAAYALIDIPQNALLALVPEVEAHRGALVAARNVAAGIARVTLAAAFVPLMAVRSPVEGALRFLILVAVMALGAIGSAAVLARTAPPNASPSVGLLERGSAWGVIGDLVRMALASAILTAVVQLEPYLAAHGIADRAVGTMIMTAVAAGSILSQPFWRFQAGRARGKLWPRALGAMAISGLAFLLLPLQSAAGAGSAGLAYGIASGGLLFVLWMAFAEKVAPQRAFAAFAWFTAAAKLGQGCSTLAVGLLIQHYHASFDDGRQAIAAPAMGGILILGALMLLAPWLVRKSGWTGGSSSNIVSVH